jgi:polar amino acid transport system permease protein
MYKWDFSFLWAYRQILILGLTWTVALTIALVALGLLIGLVVGLGRLTPSRWLRAPLTAYVEVFRCTPVLVQLIWFYYALPILTGINLSTTTACILALALYGGAFYSEIIRGGIVSIDHGQTEAGQALGMTSTQVMRRIVLPQALKRMVPPLMNHSIIQLKNTALVSVLAVPELLYQGQAIALDTYRPLEVYSLIALMYFVVLYPSTLVAQILEKRLAISD